MRPHHRHTPRSRRLWRWLIGAGLLTVLALAYGLSLNWFAHRLSADIEKAVRDPETTANDAILPR